MYIYKCMYARKTNICNEECFIVYTIPNLEDKKYCCYKNSNKIVYYILLEED